LAEQVERKRHRPSAGRYLLSVYSEVGATVAVFLIFLSAPRMAVSRSFYTISGHVSRLGDGRAVCLESGPGAGVGL
jgi:hypothetical protein